MISMFKNIIWATDGSEAADRALPYAKALAADGSLLVVHCNELLVGRAGGYSAFADDDELENKIRKQVADTQSEGIATTIMLVKGLTGHAGDKIADVARETGADLIVVGSHGHSAVGGLLLGSVTQKLLHVAPCPVLAIPPMKQTVASEASERELVEAAR
jgi:nucleotide-binding universal stress UspA family protein